MSTAPFGPQRCLLSPHGPRPLHGANARGVETVTRMSTSPVNNVNSVQSVHPEDRYLLGMKLQGNYIIDMALPFGLRSTPFIFSSVADLVEWILRHNYGLNFLLHYIEDFYTLAPPNSPACQLSLTLQARLSRDKFERIVALLESWSVKPHCSWKELESLIGTLHHACKVIPQGRTFIWRMIND